MNRFIKVILIIPAMAGSGFLGYFIAKKKYEKLADIEVENVKKKLTEYYEKNGVKLGTEDQTPKKSNDAKGTELIKPPASKTSIVPNTTTVKDYKNYAKQYITESVEKKLEAEDEANKKVTPRDQNLPYIINEREYENSNFIAKTLYYYVPDDVLTDSDGRKIEYPDELIGMEASRTLKSGEVDTLYVRNERFEADFEIMAINKSIYNRSSNERVIPEEYEK